MQEDSTMDLWVKEIYKGTMGLSFKVEKTLYSAMSEFQKIDVVQTADHGRMLLNDGRIMLCERDEFAYHEMIAHVPLFVHPGAERVLIIGGGDGGTAREVLKHDCVSRVVLVEIDGVVVDACKKHLRSLACSFDDPRLELLIEDGVQYVKNTREMFDLVIIDSTDPVGPAMPLFNRNFYHRVGEILDSKGILISQAESPYYDKEIQEVMLKNQRRFFKRLHVYLFSNISYPGGLWSFGFASKEYSPLADFDEERVLSSGINMQYYNPGVHRASFSLPTFMANHLDTIIDPL